MAIICFKVSDATKKKIMRDAGSNVVSGVKGRKSTAKPKTAKRKKR